MAKQPTLSVIVLPPRPTTDTPDHVHDKEKSTPPLTQTKSLDCRTVIHKRFSTDIYSVSPTDASTPHSLLNAFHKHVSAEAIDDFLQGSPVVTAIFVLQETGTDHPYCHYRWMTVNATEWLGFRRWYDRCVVKGTADNLKVEIHMLGVGDEDDVGHTKFQAEMEQFAIGGKTPRGLEKEYRKLRVEGGQLAHP